jgi:hypothetical protein
VVTSRSAGGEQQQRQHGDEPAAADDGPAFAALRDPAAREVAQEAADPVAQQRGRHRVHRQVRDLFHHGPDVGEAGEVARDDQQHGQQRHAHARPAQQLAQHAQVGPVARRQRRQREEPAPRESRCSTPWPR